jgi:hypothetical protein
VNVSLIPNKDKDDYEIENGLLGVNKNLFNILVTLYGISRHTLPWKNYFWFKKKDC